LPTRTPAVDAELDGRVFRIERDRAGARVACVALRAGTIDVRSAIPVAGELRRVTALEVFDQGNCLARDRLPAGRIGKLHGLGPVRIGDAIGSATARPQHGHFLPPTLQTVVTAESPGDGRRLHAALVQLAEQDPLIALRRDDARDETSLSLYGEVQKEVIAETVLREHGIAMRFATTSMLHVERPRGTASARRGPPFPFIALVALRIAPAPAGSGVTLVPEIDYGVLPAAFHLAVESAIHDTLQQGLAGWPVVDCTVYITEAIRFRDWATSTPAAHRLLAPLVVMEALRAAGTDVCEPMHRVVVHAPARTATAVLALLARLGAALEPPEMQGDETVMGAELPADRIALLQRELPALTHGEGIIESAFARYRPVRGVQPHRPRIGPDPRDLKTWLMQLGRR
jgi:ribosomal protection tetracycline resistance protein